MLQQDTASCTSIHDAFLIHVVGKADMWDTVDDIALCNSIHDAELIHVVGKVDMGDNVVVIVVIEDLV